MDNHGTHGQAGPHEKILYSEESYAIRGAIFDVYREMGCGFGENIYQECMEKELIARSIPFDAQWELELTFKGKRLTRKYIPDLVCYDIIIVELKAVKELIDEHRAQIHNYLYASKLRLGLLVNFGHFPKAEIERIIL